MATSDHTGPPRSADESEQPCDPERTVAVLDDDEAIRLFQTASAPTTIPELAEACDLATSTAYRKVERLVEAGLLREVRPATANGSPPGRYERAVDCVTVTLADDLVVTCVGDAED